MIVFNNKDFARRNKIPEKELTRNADVISVSLE